MHIFVEFCHPIWFPSDNTVATIPKRTFIAKVQICFQTPNSCFYSHIKIRTQLFTNIFTVISENMQLLHLQAHGIFLSPSRAEPLSWGLEHTLPRGWQAGLVWALLLPCLVAVPWEYLGWARVCRSLCGLYNFRPNANQDETPPGCGGTFFPHPST